MRWLLPKDLPWVSAMSAAGTIALASALIEHRGLRVFVVGADRLEAAFHVAWIAGLVLGVVAACFDEVLGTREFLRQRPVSWQRIALSRLLGCGFTLAVWFVFAPIAAWLVFAAFDEGWQHTRWAAWSRIGGTFVVALSSCAVGLAAGALPCNWLLRLVAAAAWCLASFGASHHCTTNEKGITSIGAFVAAHLAVTALLAGVAWRAAAATADADRPWSHRVRVPVVASFVIAAGLLWAALAEEGQATSLRRLHDTWPRVWRLEERVWMTVTDERRRTLVVDAAHRPTGEQSDLAPEKAESLGPDLWWRSPSYGFDAPRWHDTHQQVTSPASYASVHCAGDGHAWVQRREGRSVVTVATGKGVGRAPFAPGVRLGEAGDDVVAWEPDRAALWRYDPAKGFFEPVGLPASDVVTGLDDHDLGEDDPPDLVAALSSGERNRAWYRTSYGFVRGTKHAYVVRGGALVAVDGLLAAVERSESRQAWRRYAARELLSSGDPLEVPLHVDGAPGLAAFSHVFTPKTLRERWLAGTAIVWSVTRPPLLQLASHAAGTGERRSWLGDALVVDGRRPWLVFTGILAAAAMAVFVRRRLVALGAARSTVWFWTATTSLFGPVAFVASFVFERPRAYARRASSDPVPVPRIVSPQPVEEVLA